MNRFYLPPESFQGTNITFPADRSHQIARVLRLQTGDSVCAFDKNGLEHIVALTQVDAKSCQGMVTHTRSSQAEPKTRINLLVVLTQREKFELILQKCTEIGVDSFTPILSARSLLQGRQEYEKKQGRWARIVMEAAEQSRRVRIPAIHPVQTFAEALQAEAGQKLVAHEGEQSAGLKDVLEYPADSAIALMIGPEGGFTTGEIEQAIACSWRTFGMGPRILRMETAAITACALILSLMGDLGK